MLRSEAAAALCVQRTDIDEVTPIRASCRLAALLDLTLEEAAKQIVPLAVTAAEAIERLRTWASGRCLSSEAGGIFQKSSFAPRRRLESDPSPN